MDVVIKSGKYKIIYIDESGFDMNMDKEYGWQLLGKRLKAYKSGKRGKRVSVIGGRDESNNLIAPFTIEGYTNKEVFKFWIKEILLPSLENSKSCIVMDNASFHKGSDIEEMIEKGGHMLQYLPPYSPDLNPIEKKWAQIKTLYRKWTYFYNDKMELLDMLLREEKLSNV